ncbi:MAG: FIST C-terminal domain-containing protein [Myxococcales bacterium]|nr:FIST C-terminal domain-containing protein [Myxococcales bacterium]
MSGLNLRKGVSKARDPVVAARELHAAIGQPDTSLAIFFCSADLDREALAGELRRLFGATPLIGCTTAGEITPLGYLDGAITGVSLASPRLVALTHRTDDLASFRFSEGERSARELLTRFRHRYPPRGADDTFGLLLIDGLSNQEESFVSALSRGLGEVRLFGGSAADGTRFGETFVYHEGEFHRDAALVTLVQTDFPFSVFKTQHFEASEEKMVVTEASPSQRLVTEINGEPAGREYARAVGLSDIEELTPLVFATYPVVVRLGGQPYVRSIQKVNPDESLTFFCAIDEGIVLTVARGIDIVENLEQAFREVRRAVGPPALVLGCDCILRNIECGQKNVKEAIGRIFMENNVIGFATYGEQFNAMHVNQTFTGVAIGG